MLFAFFIFYQACVIHSNKKVYKKLFVFMYIDWRNTHTLTVFCLNTVDICVLMSVMI